MSDDRRRASLEAHDVPLVDSFEFAGPNVVPATMSFEVHWRATGRGQLLGEGDSVPAEDPAAFSGRFRPARATGSFHGEQLGFEFRSLRGTSSEEGYAELGTERNGSFL